MRAANKKVLFSVLLSTLALPLSFNACGMRFNQPPLQAAAPNVPVIGLKTILKETTDPLKPYVVQVSVSAKRYEGLVLVKAVEQIPINQKVSLKAASESPSNDLFSNSATYSQLAPISKEEFQYDDTNVNPQQVFWYAVIRPDASGNTGIVEGQEQLPQPLRMSIPPAKVNPTVQLSTSVENNGSGLKPYIVKLSVNAPMGADTDLKLVRATSTSQFHSANYTILANITQSPFEFQDTALYPTDSAVYGVVNGNKSQPYIIPSPSSVTLPSLNNPFAALTKTDITTVGDYPAVKLTFAPVFGTQYLKKSINGVEVASLELAQNQTEYLDDNLAFDKNYTYQLVQEDHYGNPAGSSATHQANFRWPEINFATEIQAVVNAKASLHQYEIRIQDLTPTIKRILQVQTSGDGTNFSPVVTWNDETVSRTYTLDFNAPTTRYARLVQYDRYNNQLAASPIYNLVIPADLEYSGLTNLNANQTGYGRIKFANNATLVYGAGSYTISAKKLIIDGTAHIRAYATGSQASLNTPGANAGDITLTFETAIGTLNINSQGQIGGSGSPGTPGAVGATGYSGSNGVDMTAVCRYSDRWHLNMYGLNTPATAGGRGGTGGNGGNGSPGFTGQKGGASGKINLTITTDVSGFTAALNSSPILGGSGGAGGSPGPGGPGGPGGVGGRRSLHQSELPSACSKSVYTWDTFNNDPAWVWWSGPYDLGRAASGPQGYTGAAGARGADGPSGQPGQGSQSCQKYPGQTVQTCNY